MNSPANPATRDFLCNLTEDDPPAQEFWATRNNAWVLLIPFVGVLMLLSARLSFPESSFLKGEST